MTVNPGRSSAIVDSGSMQWAVQVLMTRARALLESQWVRVCFPFWGRRRLRDWVLFLGNFEGSPLYRVVAEVEDHVEQ